MRFVPALLLTVRVVSICLIEVPDIRIVSIAITSHPVFLAFVFSEHFPVKKVGLKSPRCIVVLRKKSGMKRLSQFPVCKRLAPIGTHVGLFYHCMTVNIQTVQTVYIKYHHRP